MPVDRARAWVAGRKWEGRKIQSECMPTSWRGTRCVRGTLNLTLAGSKHSTPLWLVTCCTSRMQSVRVHDQRDRAALGCLHIQRVRKLYSQARSARCAFYVRPIPSRQLAYQSIRECIGDAPHEGDEGPIEDANTSSVSMRPLPSRMAAVWPHRSEPGSIMRVLRAHRRCDRS